MTVYYSIYYWSRVMTVYYSVYYWSRVTTVYYSVYYWSRVHDRLLQRLLLVSQE